VQSKNRPSRKQRVSANTFRWSWCTATIHTNINLWQTRWLRHWAGTHERRNCSVHNSTLGFSSGKRYVSAWRPSVCLSVCLSRLFLSLIERTADTQRDSPEGNMVRSQHTFRPDNKEDRYSCMKTWRHPENRKYITYRIAVRGGPSQGRSNM